MSGHGGFVMLPSYYEAIRTLEDNQRLALYDTIMAYVFDGQEPQGLQGAAQGMFSLMKPNIDSSLRRYEASVQNGKKGGRPPKPKPSQNLLKTKTKPSGKHDKDKECDKDMDKEYKAPKNNSTPTEWPMKEQDKGGKHGEVSNPGGNPRQTTDRGVHGTQL